MKRISLWFASTTSVLVLLLSYHTSTGSGASASSRPVAVSGVVGTAASATSGSTTVNGSSVATRYGDIQVQIVVSGGKVTSATTIQYSTRGRDGEINAYALPVLQQATVSAQSASIDTVSGATFTSEGYKQSLQSALDAANL